MALLIDNVNIEDVKYNGTDIDVVNCDSVEVWKKATTPGRYIAEGDLNTVNGNYRVRICNNNNGVKGSVVTTIAKNQWETLAQYAPEIAICENDICREWTGVGVPLNFAKLTKIGNIFLYNCTTFNQPISFPQLVEAGDGLIQLCYAFNQELHFPQLTKLGYATMYQGGNWSNKVTFDKLVMTSNIARNFINNGSVNNSIITVEFRTRQTISALNNNGTETSFYYRNTANTIHSYVDLRIATGSTNVNVAARTWAGHTFRSVTLI